MRDILRLSLPLVVICLLAGLAIGAAHSQAMPRIERTRQAALAGALADVLPPGASVRQRSAAAPLPQRYWTATRGSRVVAYAFEVSCRGYSGDVRFVAGMDTAGTLLGLRVLSQSETPGLGSRVSERVCRRYLWQAATRGCGQQGPWFGEQFRGISLTRRINVERLAEWHELNGDEQRMLAAENSVTAIAGATVSTAAVVRGLEQTAYVWLRGLRRAEAR